MSGKAAKKLRKALRKVNVNIYSEKYFLIESTRQIVADEGRRVYQKAKKKAKEIRKRGGIPQIIRKNKEKDQ